MTGPRAIVASLVALVVCVGAAPAAADTTVSLNFDDGSADQMVAKQMLADRGLHGTFFIIPGRVGDSNYLTWGEIGSVYADGNEIGGHTVTHLDLPTLPPDQQRSEICDARQDLLARGYPQLSFAYPFGHHDPATETLVEQCGSASGRGSGGLAESPAETIPPLDRWAIRTRNSVTAADTVGTLEKWVLDAEAVGDGWLNIVFHHICDANAPDPPCTSYHVTPPDLSAFLDWLKSRESVGTQVKTIGEASLTPQPPLMIFRAVRSRRNGTAKLALYIRRSGVLRVADAASGGAAKHKSRVKPVSMQVSHPGVVTVTLRPTTAGRRTLRSRGRLRLPAMATFAPTAGSPASLTVRVTLRKKS